MIAPPAANERLSIPLKTTNPCQSLGWFHTCGGSILDETHVLTASHCCFGFVPSDLTIVAGEHHLYDDTDDGTEQGTIHI